MNINDYLPKNELISFLTVAGDISELDQNDLETLVLYLQYACEFLGTSHEYTVPSVFFSNFEKLRSIAAQKLLKRDHVYALFTYPAQPLITKETGDKGIILALTESAARVLEKEQNEAGRRCFIVELLNEDEYLQAYFLVEGYDHAALWNSNMNVAPLMKDDFFDANEQAAYEKCIPNNGLANTISIFHQQFSSGMSNEDKDYFDRIEKLTFASLMAASLIVPVKRDEMQDIEKISVSDLMKHVPIYDFDAGYKKIKILPLYTDMFAISFSKNAIEEYGGCRLDLETILDSMPCSHFVLNPETIGLIMEKGVAENMVNTIKHELDEIKCCGVNENK